MIDKHCYQWIKKVLFHVILQPTGIREKAAVGNLGVRAASRRVVSIEAFTSWSCAIVAIIADPSSGAIKWAEQVGASLCKTRASHGHWQQTLSDSDR